MTVEEYGKAIFKILDENEGEYVYSTAFRSKRNLIVDIVRTAILEECEGCAKIAEALGNRGTAIAKQIRNRNK